MRRNEMLIRDKYKLIEISDVIYEEKEGRFIFKDMRNRIIARLSLANPRDEQLIEYAFRLMTKWFRTYGYVDIYNLNQAVDNFKGEFVEDDQLASTYTKPVREPVVIPKPEVAVKPITPKPEVTVEPLTVEPFIQPIPKPVIKPTNAPVTEPVIEVVVEPEIEPEIEATEIQIPLPEVVIGFDTPIIEGEAIEYELLSETVREATLSVSSDDSSYDKFNYIDTFLISSMQCTSIEQFSELILRGINLGVSKEVLCKELSFVSKDKLVKYASQLGIVNTVDSTRDKIIKEIINTLVK